MQAFTTKLTSSFWVGLWESIAGLGSGSSSPLKQPIDAKPRPSLQTQQARNQREPFESTATWTPTVHKTVDQNLQKNPRGSNYVTYFGVQAPSPACCPCFLAVPSSPPASWLDGDAAILQDSGKKGARIFFCIFLGFFLVFLFGFVLFLAIWKHPSTICGHVAASRRRLASRTTISGQIMGARQSLGLSGFRASGF